MSRRDLYFSCEIGSREVLPRVLLGLRLARYGFRTVVAHKFALSSVISDLPRGVFFHKDANQDSLKYFGAARKGSHFNVATDEEFAFHSHIGERQGALVCKEAKPLVDHAFCSSVTTRASMVAQGLPSTLVGNLRLAYASFLGNAAHLNSKPFDDALLFNSNVGGITAGTPLWRQLEIRARLHGLTGAAEWQLLKVDLRQQMDSVDRILELIMRLSTSGKRVVFRPHPGESEEFWRFALPASIAIDERGRTSISSASRVNSVVGGGCATLIEAAILGKNLINFQNEIKNSYVNDIFPPVKYGKELNNPTESVPGIWKTILGESEFDILQRWYEVILKITPEEPDNLTGEDILMNLINSNELSVPQGDVGNRYPPLNIPELQELYRCFPSQSARLLVNSRTRMVLVLPYRGV